MTVPISIVMGIISVAFSGGVVVGMFGYRFVARKECTSYRKELWDRVDALQDVMSGGRYQFEVRLVPKRERDG